MISRFGCSLAGAFLIVLAGCGTGPAASSGGAHLRIIRPSQDQVVVVHSLAVQTEVTGVDGGSLTYYLDGANQGSGDTSITIPQLSPGRHRLEVEAFDAQGRPLSPRLRAGVDFTVQ